MGSFYSNITLRGPRQQEVANALKGHEALVAPTVDGYTVVFDSKCDEQDQDGIAHLAAQLSRRFQCPALAILVHDDDILWFQLYLNGALADEYNSTPGYFDPIAEPSPPTGGNATLLATTFGSDADTLENILRKSALEDDGYLFQSERHADLVHVLGLPAFTVGTGYESFEQEDYPEELSVEMMLRPE